MRSDARGGSLCARHLPNKDRYQRISAHMVAQLWLLPRRKMTAHSREKYFNNVVTFDTLTKEKSTEREQ